MNTQGGSLSLRLLRNGVMLATFIQWLYTSGPSTVPSFFPSVIDGVLQTGMLSHLDRTSSVPRSAPELVSAAPP